MYPPIFTVCAADSAVTTLLGTTPTRLYPFGEAPQEVVKPYAVWQIINGAPENVLSDAPDVDSYTVQVDVYADTGASVRSVVQALRNAIQPVAHITAWRGESKESETGLYRYSFDCDWWVQR
jgi:hypothetical protein